MKNVIKQCYLTQFALCSREYIFGFTKKQKQAMCFVNIQFFI